MLSVKKLTLISSLLISTSSFADIDGAYLSPAFNNLKHPKVNDKNNKNSFNKSNTLSVVNHMTPVRSQGSRGTCSIFSATALLEGMLVINGQTTPQADLSEEWLEYLVISTTRSTTDGSYTNRNLDLMRRYGMATEQVLPYQSANWSKSDSLLENERCSHLINSERTMCELGHFDPNLIRMNDTQLSAISAPYISTFMQAKDIAARVKSGYIRYTSNYYVGSSTNIKNLLDSGKPVILDQNFYYGAWNHRLADQHGIGRDETNWSKGIVGFPEPGSMDYKKSRENPAGHSVLVVGYDDNKVVTTNVLMQDGTYKKFSYKGVYYFKNSWGTSSFGTQTNIDGSIQPGYGIMTQKYAHQYGSFFTIRQ